MKRIIQPLVSIIVPTYNRAHLIGETLDSVLAQTYKNWECIVVDDSSTDNTEEVIELYIKKDLRFQFIKRPTTKPKGANACRNYGFGKSKGKYINWFDSDDLMHPEKLAIQVKALKQSNYNFSVCQSLVFEDNIDNIIGLKHDTISSEQPFEDFVTKQIIWLTQAPLWRRDFLNKMEKLFDERLQAAQEWEFHSRALSLSPQYNVIDKPLVYLRHHKESISLDKDEDKRLWHYFLARYFIYTNSQIKLNSELQNYLREFLLRIFKKMVDKPNIEMALKQYFLFIIKEEQVKNINKIYSLLAIFSYAFFRRGYFFSRRIKLKT